MASRPAEAASREPPTITRGDDDDHTYETFVAHLREIVAVHRTLSADALIDDGWRALVLVRARAGRVEITRLEERPEDALTEPIALPLDEVLQVELARDHDEIAALLEELDGDESSLPLEYPDLETLQRLVDRIAAAIDEGGGTFVAAVDLDRYLVELEPGSARIRRLVVVTEPVLVGRLLGGNHAAAAPAAREPEHKYEIALFFPDEMLTFMQDEAARLACSLSAIAQEAFAHARYTIAQSARPVLEEAIRSFGAVTTRRKQTLLFPGEMLDAMERQATRLDASVSLIAQGALALARKSIAARPDDPTMTARW